MTSLTPPPVQHKTVLVDCRWGRYTVTPVNTYTGPTGQERQPRKRFWAYTVLFLNGTAIYETQTPDSSRTVESPAAPAGPGEATPPKSDRIRIDSSLHDQSYWLAVGQEVVLWVDRGDDRGRYPNYPAHIVCEVVDEPNNPDARLLDPYSQLTSVRVKRIEFRESAWFMRHMTEPETQMVVGPFSPLPPKD